MLEVSRSLTALKDSFKLLMAIATNNDFKLASVNIHAAFLQSRTLDHDVFVKPLDEVKKPGTVWRLKKPLYGLDNASRKFWLRVKEVFFKMNMKIMEGDKAFYYLHRGGILIGIIISHVDDFTLAGTQKFIDEVLEMVEKELTISKIEKDNFRYTGLNIFIVNKGIEIEMADYVESL